MHPFKLLLAAFGIVSAFMVTALMNKPRPIVRTSVHTHIQIHTHSDKFTPERFRVYLKCLNIKHADIVFAQAVLETGGFKSHVFRANNNLFGMRLAKSRSTTALGSKNGHAYYSSWKQSVVDYAMFYSKYLSRLSRKEYLDYLSDNYAEDPGYVGKLKRVINKY